ncbi:stationary phase growth adaptation protein [Salmonella enterica]|nr:stationary phase growth adaptation protein [Salmonella enterica]EFO8529228.1 stationary phase growth adaptation protein [Salmonella enterica]EGG4120847.1 stationary phase growth adaptation protein [Salmonella enterica]EGG4135116.1 stationary phase growth adaptation protein [Salmonella enterica]EGG4280872.1 stationary phase growth adaptation protein [Salmonella enterica]
MNRGSVAVNTEEVQKWKAFNHPDGTVRDLSFLDAHEVTYIQSAPGKSDKVYKFFVTYSFHCFCKGYDEQTEEMKASLMYFAPKDKRPFCERRYELARSYLRQIVDGLGSSKVTHAGYGSYAVVEVDLAEGETEFYFVAFRAFKEKKKLRLHITSAYPVTERTGGQKVSFFKIAYNLLAGKPLPHPQK